MLSQELLSLLTILPLVKGSQVSNILTEVLQENENFLKRLVWSGLYWLSQCKQSPSDQLLISNVCNKLMQLKQSKQSIHSNDLPSLSKQSIHSNDLPSHILAHCFTFLSSDSSKTVVIVSKNFLNAAVQTKRSWYYTEIAVLNLSMHPITRNGGSLVRSLCFYHNLKSAQVIYDSLNYFSNIRLISIGGLKFPLLVNCLWQLFGVDNQNNNNNHLKQSIQNPQNVTLHLQCDTYDLFSDSYKDDINKFKSLMNGLSLKALSLDERICKLVIHLGHLCMQQFHFSIEHAWNLEKSIITSMKKTIQSVNYLCAHFAGQYNLTPNQQTLLVSCLTSNANYLSLNLDSPTYLNFLFRTLNQTKIGQRRISINCHFMKIKHSTLFGHLLYRFTDFNNTIDGCGSLEIYCLCASEDTSHPLNGAIKWYKIIEKKPPIDFSVVPLMDSVDLQILWIQAVIPHYSHDLCYVKIWKNSLHAAEPFLAKDCFGVGCLWCSRTGIKQTGLNKTPLLRYRFGCFQQSI